MKRLILRLFIFVATAMVLGELLFRFVIPVQQVPKTVFRKDFGIAQFDPNYKHEGLFTFGRWAQKRAVWHINQQGWNNPEDYLPRDKRTKPLIAVIGDSYVEGFHVDWRDHLPAQIREQFKGQVDVYVFGRSLTCFSYYRSLAKYVEAEFDPDLYVIFANLNDEVQSVQNLGDRPETPQVRVENGMMIDKPAKDVWKEAESGSLFRQLVRARRKSALFQYLTQYAGWKALTGGNLNLDDAKLSYNDRSPEQKKMIADVMEYMFKSMKTELRNKPVLIALNCDLRGMYATPMSGTPPYLPTHQLIADACTHSGLGFLDLTDILWPVYQTEGKHFEFAEDPHWNQYGRRVIAQGVAGYIKTTGMLNSVADSYAMAGGGN